MKLQVDLREFVELLNSRLVEYVIVGGHAVAFHGYPRFTGDIDFFVRPSSQNAARLLDVLATFGFGDVGLDEATFTQPDKVIQLGRPPNRIDLLTSISGLDFDEAWAGRIDAELDGIPVRFPSRDSLLRNKRAAGRAKDLADVEALELTAVD
jgi:hypothetical protein